MFDWNDLKAFLAVAREGSTLGASRALGVNQTTVARRIEGLEQALSLRLFERGQTGSRLTEAGRDLLAEAEKVERAAKDFGVRAEAHQRGLAGSLRITSIEMLANTTLARAIAEFRRLHPEVQVDLISTDEFLDLEGGEVDIAFRTAVSLQPSNLVARRIMESETRLYCSRDYAAHKGAPAALADLADHDLLGGEGGLERMPGMVWMFEQAGGKAPASRSNTLTTLMHAVGAGLGIAPLPAIIADADPNLVRCSEPIEQARGSAWLMTRKELKDTPRVRAFIDFVIPFIQRDMRAREAHIRKLRGAEAANDTDPGALKSPA